MTEPAAAAQPEHGWIGPIAALIALSVIPLIPPLRVLVPIEPAFILLAPALAVCALVGWWSGGRLWLVLLWIALAVWLLYVPGMSATLHFDKLERGWALLLSASFGMVCLIVPGRPFLTKALSAVVLAMGISLVVVRVVGGSGPLMSEAVAAEYHHRNLLSLSAFEEQLSKSAWFRELAGSYMKEAPVRLEDLANRSARVFPSLLALQSLATLALAWSLFHRISRTRIGEPLLKLSEFRFDDQFVWGLLAGLTLIVIPSLEELRAFGWILVVFFAGMYVVRGMGVAAFLLGPRRRWQGAVAVVLMLALPTFAIAALLGLGVGDTWADWRRPRPTA